MKPAHLVLIAMLTLAPAAAADPLEAAVQRSEPAAPEVARNVAAARAAARGQATPELLLAMAWVESRYVTTGVSRLECDAAGACRRVRGNWPRPFPPRFAPPYFCGVLQARVRTSRACFRVGADIEGGYAAAVEHVEAWLRFCARDRQARRHRDRLSCALAGYNGGTAAAREGRQRYARAVLSRARRLADGWPAPRGSARPAA